MIAVPNYGGSMDISSVGWIQTTAIHNLGIMSVVGLQGTLPEDLSAAAEASPAGCLSRGF